MITWIEAKFIRDEAEAFVARHLAPIHQKLEAIMATQAEFQAAFDRINAATNQVATLLNNLRDQVSELGLDATVEAQLLSQLQGAAGALEAMAVTPTDPVPVEPPPVEPVEPAIEPAP